MTIETAQTLLQIAKDELELDNRRGDIRRAIENLSAYVAARTAPTYFSLIEETNDQWRIGAFSGVTARGMGGKELGRALTLLALAVSCPGYPYPVYPLLEPGKDLDNALHSGRSMVSRARKWIEDEIDVGLAYLLKAVRVVEDDFGAAVAVYSPPAGTPPILTSFPP